ncbi:O-sialoglycoprotein endopeptidase [Desulfocicer vacuolatum DSM 3385]|uniref:tRNA N6-adenosine threonylcarbamoyltransferase n=1 Tax=Desulfocicer vacuolatum DSM 3385 TaxID=1121400 RepID=A0A1W2E1X6_9BACT|nr:tRNA (adenosine(37)-N6)-threonylcarbamoyltransferase complex transferase subunit TsaD [Desulfocicer vacuolatum]SMD03709.1 O-sialoglycoprotein endopeptidase [Desulfocicer vacuolatum DSM 3385]
MIILGIESSCDETAAAVVEDGCKILSSIVSTQVEVHHKYGGVVPELASRMHMEAILPVVTQALETAGITMDDIDGVAATRGPGLVGALLVGFSFAKAFAWARGLPWTGVNHLEGHIYSVFLGKTPPSLPFVILLASGGHTNLYHVTSPNDFELMGQTRDDAAGEAFDKVAKMLGLGYPGGAVIEKLAAKGDPGKIRFPRSYLDKEGFDFSFSGLKSAVARHLQQRKEPLTPEDVADIAASFQEAVLDVLSFKLINAARVKGCRTVALAGGVSANTALGRRVAKDAAARKMTLALPPLSLCGDNAAMIAARGHRLIQDGTLCQLDHDVFSRTRV